MNVVSDGRDLDGQLDRYLAAHRRMGVVNAFVAGAGAGVVWHPILGVGIALVMLVMALVLWRKGGSRAAVVRRRWREDPAKATSDLRWLRWLGPLARR